MTHVKWFFLNNIKTTAIEKLTLFWLKLPQSPELYSEPCQTTKMKLFEKLVSTRKSLTIFAKHSILDIRQGSEHVSEISSVLFNILYHHDPYSKSEKILHSFIKK